MQTKYESLASEFQIPKIFIKSITLINGNRIFKMTDLEINLKFTKRLTDFEKMKRSICSLSDLIMKVVQLKELIQ